MVFKNWINAMIDFPAEWRIPCACIVFSLQFSGAAAADAGFDFSTSQWAANVDVYDSSLSVSSPEVAYVSDRNRPIELDVTSAVWAIMFDEGVKVFSNSPHRFVPNTGEGWVIHRDKADLKVQFRF